MAQYGDGYRLNCRCFDSWQKQAIAVLLQPYSCRVHWILFTVQCLWRHICGQCLICIADHLPSSTNTYRVWNFISTPLYAQLYGVVLRTRKMYPFSLKDISYDRNRGNYVYCWTLIWDLKLVHTHFTCMFCFTLRHKMEEISSNRIS